MANLHDNGNPDNELPKSLVDTLRQADAFQPDVPSNVDRAILEDAHTYLDAAPRIIRQRRVFRAIAAVSTVCAALLLFVFLRSDRAPLPQLAQEVDSVPEPSAAIDSKDIDRNGTINILDAFAMARSIQAGSLDARQDFNGDGELNDDDVRLVAMDAVML